MEVLIILTVLASFIFSVSEAQQINSSNIGLGSSLNATSSTPYWSSKSGHFAFGFYPESNGYAVGIWLPKIQQKTVVWTANRDDPLLSNDSRLILGSDGWLVLQSDQGQEKVIADASEPASSASMLDSGNFVLYNKKMDIIWKTFDFPTDTILSTQTLVNRQRLVSSKSETDHSRGKFLIAMQADGNLVQYPTGINWTTQRSYWDSATYKGGNSTSLILDNNGSLYLQNSNGLLRRFKGGESVSYSIIYRATVDADGIFRLYSHNLSVNGNWSVRWSSSNNRCDPKGVCGLNGYCTLAGQLQEPVCDCPPGFDFIDAGQRSLGCQRNSSAYICLPSNAKAFNFQQLNDVEWDYNPNTSVSMSPIQCQEECARDCNCEVALYVKQQCSKQRLPLQLGRNISGQSQQMITFMKVPNGVSREKTEGAERKNNVQTGTLITWIVLSTISCLSVVIVGILVYKYRVWKFKRIASQGNDELLEDVTLRSYTYDELKCATNDFTNQIGKGAFGIVFRGVMSNGNRVVAIKRLEIEVAEGEREFRNEMKAIGRTHHKNLVHLLGYCHEGTNRLLVFEFMSNGSLADFLFKSEMKPVWKDRIEIALNIARGILYLHEECPTQIIHCDVKPENILMDEKECPKIADFGLSKLLLPNQSKTYTGMRGTRGYVAPEWHRNSPITVKADVYSFGIMLLEIVCCRRNVDMDASEDEVVLANFVYDCFEAGEVNNLVQDEEVETSELDRVIRVGLWCIQDEPSVRPSMKKVVLMLEGTIDIPAPPNPPSFASSI